MSTSFDNAQKRHFDIRLFCADAFACVSLICTVGLWPLSFVVPKIAMITGPQALRVMAVSVVLAGISALLGSRLWKFALPIAVLMFFFVMYANGV